MKNKKIILPVLLLLVILGLWTGYVRGDIGLSEKTMCREAAQYMGDGDVSTCQIGETMAAFLHYNVEEDDYDIDIYVKRKGNIGWFFRFSGASNALNYLQRLNCEGNSEYVLCYLSAGPQGNAPEVSKIEIDEGNGTAVIITPEEGEPFAYVMDRRWNVVAYDGEGNIIQPVERKM